MARAPRVSDDPLALRGQRKKDRQDRILVGMGARPPQTVKVEPRDDDVKRVLKHPRAGAFKSTGSTEWPMDQFTQRRINDGSVKLAEEKRSSSSSSDAS
jgi:hypothetical protein